MLQPFRSGDADGMMPDTRAGWKIFYRDHGLCPLCRGEGVKMAGWSPPANAGERQRAEDIGVETLPFYSLCAECGGTGKIGEQSRKMDSSDVQNCSLRRPPWSHPYFRAPFILIDNWK